MVNFFRPHLHIRAVIVLQRQQGEPFAVVEITGVQAIEKENESRYHKREAEEDQDDDHFHVPPLAERTAVSVTTATELAGMNTAAATGVTSPAAQQAMAATL